MSLLILKQLFHRTFLAITASVLMEECDNKKVMIQTVIKVLTSNGLSRIILMSKF